MKVAPHIVELMHAKIDGIISERENDELEDFLGQNPEAREQMDQLEQVSARLDRTQMVAPPPALRTRILAAIRPSTAGSGRQSPLTRRTALSYAYAVAAGLILGILGYHVVLNLDRATIDPTDVAATMAPRGAYEEVPLSVWDGSGMVRFEQVPGGVSMLFELDSPQAIEVVLAFDGTEVGFRGFSQDLGEIGDLQVTNESIAWTQSGHHRLAVVVSLEGPTASTVDLQLSTAGETPFSITLRLPEPQ
jgi:hypothetical protein